MWIFDRKHKEWTKIFEPQSQHLQTFQNVVRYNAKVIHLEIIFAVVEGIHVIATSGDQTTHWKWCNWWTTQRE